MPIKNYTTSQNEESTVGKIMGLLAAKGARQVSISYDEQNRPQAISFLILFQNSPIPFKLPCNFEGVYRSQLRDCQTELKKRRFKANRESVAQSRRIAWRIIQDWVEAQMALIEAEQASLAEVFLPYAQTNGQSVFKAFIDTLRPDRALESGEGQETGPN
jgi:hypothetical protein